MDVQQILQTINSLIARLEQARALLSQVSADADSSSATASITKRRGRPPLFTSAARKPTGKRKISSEGRARIVAAQKKRWAKSKRATKVVAIPSASERRVESPKKATAKKTAKPKAAPVTPKTTASKQVLSVKKAASAKKTVAAKKAALTAKTPLRKKRASSLKKTQEPKNSAEIIPDSAGHQLIDTPAELPITTETPAATI